MPMWKVAATMLVRAAAPGLLTGGMALALVLPAFGQKPLSALLKRVKADCESTGGVFSLIGKKVNCDCSKSSKGPRLINNRCGPTCVFDAETCRAGKRIGAPKGSIPNPNGTCGCVCPPDTVLAEFGGGLFSAPSVACAPKK